MNESSSQRVHKELGATVYGQLVHDSLAVGLHCVATDMELVRYVVYAAPLGEHRQHLALPGAELFIRVTSLSPLRRLR